MARVVALSESRLRLLLLGTLLLLFVTNLHEHPGQRISTAPMSFRDCALPGPNSGGFQMPGFEHLQLLETEGEGRAHTRVRSKGVSCNQAPDKNHSEKPGLGHPEAPLGATHPPVKRSFKRALRRLELNGFVVYRGKLHTSLPVPQPLATSTPSLKSTESRTTSKRNKPGKRATMFSWNCQSMNSAMYIELLNWIYIQQFDLALLQGTSWSLEEPWETFGFAAFPSAEPSGQKGGLLTLVNKRFCPIQNVSFASPRPGRLQHLRCHLGSNSVDVVNCYQYTTNVTKDRMDPIKFRKLFWNDLDQIICRAPFRNVLVIAGDFNSTLHSTSTSSPTPEFADLAQRRSLCSLRSNDRTPSFVGPAGSSHIDYILMRRPQADHEAKQALRLTGFPLIQGRTYPDHYPIACSFSLGWKAWYFQHQQGKGVLSKQTIQHVWKAYQDQTNDWHTFEQSAMDILSSSTTLDVEAPIPQLLQLCRRSFPAHENNSAPLWTQHQPRSLVARKWKHLFFLKNTPSLGLRHLVQAWYHAVQHQKLTKTLKSMGQEKKKEKLLAATRQATLAAQRHDSRGLYEAIRTLAPKQTKRMIRFRSPTGGLLSPAEEIQILKDHFTGIFNAAASELPPMMHIDFPLTVQDVASQLRQVGTFKAVAPNTIPTALLKALAQPIAEWTTGSVMPTKPNFGSRASDLVTAMLSNALDSTRLALNNFTVACVKTSVELASHRHTSRMKPMKHCIADCGLAPPKTSCRIAGDVPLNVFRTSEQALLQMTTCMPFQLHPLRSVPCRFLSILNHVYLKTLWRPCFVRTVTTAATPTQKLRHISREFTKHSNSLTDTIFFVMRCEDFHNAHTASSSTLHGEALLSTSLVDTAHDSTLRDPCRFPQPICPHFENMLARKLGWPCLRRRTWPDSYVSIVSCALGILPRALNS